MDISLASRKETRIRIWEILDLAQPGNHIARYFNTFILALIFTNIIAVILSTVKSIESRYSNLLEYFELFSVIIFTCEYVLRLWACTTEYQYSKTKGRIKFFFTPLALIDLLAILPFYIPLLGIDLRFLRTLRLFRIFRIIKAARYISSLKLFSKVFKAKKEELIITSVVMLMLLILSSSMMYFVENEAQPDKFTDIPTTMWWSVATLTTVGYGDVFPVTTAGKLIASFTAIIGIGLFALPTGILGAGFVGEFQKSKSKANERCPHCGEEIDKAL